MRPPSSRAAGQIARPGCAARRRSSACRSSSLGWESFDLVLPRSVYFRRLFQDLVALIGSERGRRLAAALEGYDLGPLGQLVNDPEAAPASS